MKKTAPVIRYGKPCRGLLDHKQAFFTENDAKLTDFKRLAEFYVSQPRRRQCKNCLEALGPTDFKSFGVEYVFCSRCGHLNGAHEDTDDFCEILYTQDDGESYGSVYESEGKDFFKKRMEDIYLPKALFLAEALREQGENPAEIAYADLGSGSGYFVAALLAAGMSKVQAFEASKSQAKLGNLMLETNLIECHRLSEITGIIPGLRADTVSLIGVLEHLQNPREVLRALTKNKRMRYLFLSLPLFSPCVFFEMLSTDVMPRQLVGGHTHLYTESSIAYFCNEFGFQRIAEWWFGTDFVDLYRHIFILLEKSREAGNMSRIWDRIFKPVIDDVQLALDRHRACSEVHVLLKATE